jgi:hypothetical protein
VTANAAHLTNIPIGDWIRRKDPLKYEGKGRRAKLMEDGVKEAYCRTCGHFTPLLEEPLKKDEQSPFPSGNYVCGECYSILLTVRLNTSRKPGEGAPER